MSTEYTSIEKQMQLDAQTYLERADMYLKLDMYGHASGCLAKAAKKITYAQSIGSLLSDEGLNRLLKSMIERMSAHVSDSILKA